MQNFKMFSITPKLLQIDHVVNTINSRGYELHQFEKLLNDQWLVVYRGLELIQLAKSTDLDIKHTLDN